MPSRRILLLTCAAAALILAMRSPSDATGPVIASAPSGSAADRPTFENQQSVPARPSEGSEVAPGLAAQDAPVDVSALRYFAAQKNAVRVAAELRLLRKVHPGFEPPEDLYGDEQGSGDEQALWDLYAQHDLVALRARMADLRHGDPSWHASGDLAGKLALAEGRDALVKASDEKRWSDAVGIAAANKGLLTCQDPDALWRTAEALIQSGDEARGLAAYRYVLTTCDAKVIRAATVEKAISTLHSPASVDQLLLLGRPQADGHGEFDKALLDHIRQSVSAAASGSGGSEPSPEDVDRLSKIAEGSPNGSDAQLLGWLAYARSDFSSAQRWFQTALGIEKDAKAAEGLVLSLRSAADNAGARQAALQFAPLGESNRKLMLEVLTASLTDPGAKPLTADEMDALIKAVDDVRSQDGAQSLSIYATNRKDTAGSKLWYRKFIQWKGDEIEASRSAEGAEALGWLLYQANDVSTAESWFKKSAEWAPSEAAAVGLVVASRRLHHDKDYAKWLAQYSAAYPQVAQLGRSMQSHAAPVHVARVVKHLTRVAQATVLHGKTRVARGGDWDQSASDIVTAAQSGQYDRAFAMLEQRRGRRPEPRGLSVVRGWVLYHRGQWDEAKQVFDNLDHGSYSPERREGLRVIEMSYTPSRL